MKRSHVTTMLAAMRALDGSTTPDGYRLSVELSRAYGRRRYTLTYLLPSLVHGSSIMLDTTEDTLWCAPTPSTFTTSPERERLWDIMRPALDVAQSLQRTHGTPLVYPTRAVPGRETYRLA